VITKIEWTDPITREVLLQTHSEALVSLANRYYHRQGKCKIYKNDARIRQGMFVASRGLDFSGVLEGGKYISFEVKETELDRLPIHNISIGQIDTMEREANMSENVFLLVCFRGKNQKNENGHRVSDDEWYLLDWDNMRVVVDLNVTSIPKRYFQAFGMLVPSSKGYPEYLSPEAYPTRNSLREGFPDWIHVRKDVDVDAIPEPVSLSKEYLDPEKRRARIMKAMSRGVESAKRHEEKVQIFITRRRSS
jgi:penicillin-binding protein-related factor A (putative recombinase)